ncbi:hypothetical protein KCU90_g65, partial [Aureobasidium melanogenum]
MTFNAWSSCAHVSSKYLFASQAGCGFSVLTTSFVEPILGAKPLLSLPERRRLVLVDGELPVASLVENEYISDCIWGGCVLGFLRLDSGWMTFERVKVVVVRRMLFPLKLPTVSFAFWVEGEEEMNLVNALQPARMNSMVASEREVRVS